MAKTETPAPPRRLEYLRLADVRPAKRNPKDHDHDRIAGWMERFGFTESALMDERTGRLVVGHGRLETLQRQEAAGADVPEGIVVDDAGHWTIPVTRGWSSANDEEAEAYLIVSNKGPEVGGWKNDELAAMVAEYEALTSGWALGVGFEEQEYRDLLSETGLLGEQEGDFLSDLSGPAADPAAAPAGDRARTGTDAVDFRLAMAAPQREEAIVILRREARARGFETLAETLLAILRALPEPAEG